MKAYAIAEQCQVFGLNDNINPLLSVSVETVIVRNFGVYLQKKTATRKLNKINLEAKKTLGKKASEYFVTDIDLITNKRRNND